MYAAVNNQLSYASTSFKIPLESLESALIRSVNTMLIC